MVAQISIPVSNVATLIAAGQTRAEIWLSTDGGGQYEEVTAATAAGAFLESLAASTKFRMGGRLVKLRVDGGAERSIDFNTVVEYWSPSQVAARINEVVAGLASVSGNKVRIQSSTLGRVGSVEITYNDAPDLGWVAGLRAFGKDARITLSGGTLLYTYTDAQGASTYRYKWRFSANGASPVSEFSSFVLGAQPPLGSVALSIGTASFIGLDGKPVKRKLIIFSDESPSMVMSGIAIGAATPFVVETDDFGYLQVPLVQGSKVKVAIEGTTYVREFVVPSTASFNILTAMGTAPDPFTVQTPAPYLTRRSL